MLDIHWVPVGSGRLALTHRPKIRDIHLLPALGCQRVVTLLYEKEGGPSIGRAVENAGMAWTWLPVPNGQYPEGETHALLLAALPVLAERLAAGESILIHCAAGIHRTGMLAYALLRWHGYTGEQALERIGLMRSHTQLGLQDRQIAWGEDVVKAIKGDTGFTS